MVQGSLLRAAGVGPESPAFARAAAEFLREGDAQGALRMCVEGVKRFPTYATGFLMLGRSYEALGRHVEALVEYRRVTMMLPGVASLAAMMERVKETERTEFREFVEQRQAGLEAARNVMTLDEYLGGAAGRRDNAVEFLLRQVDEVRKAAPPPGSAGETEGVRDTGEGQLKIVTATLAEIYASQGEYEEAMKAYRRLIELGAGDIGRYRERMDELEILARQARSDRP